MMKTHKWQIVLSSLLVLVPMAAGAIFWDELPELMPHHVGITGEADAWGPKAFVVFGLPLILLVFHWLCLLITAKDKKNKEQNAKVISVVMWILPALSLFVSGLMYSIAMGEVLSLYRLLPLFLGILFIVIGNYLPKCKQNRTIGIKLKWTLISEKNWNATHRYGGKVWVAGGTVMLVAAALPMSLVMWVIMAVTAVMVILPTVFSYRMFKKQVEIGDVSADAKSPFSKKQLIFSAVIITVVAVAVIVLMFTGHVSIRYDEASFTVEASYYKDMTINYDRIDSVGLFHDTDIGSRMAGFGSARLQMGHFQSDFLGDYTLYAYTNSEWYVLIVSGEERILIGLDTKAEAEKLCDTVNSHIT